jgi:LmbE family N-acetylglucosaminyl deacetylase
MTTPLRILVFGAHPDDCEYTCGGSAALWTRAGHKVKFVSVTDGRSGHHLIPPDKLVAIRKREAADAARVLGVESEVLDFPDGSLQPVLDVRDKIIRIEREFRPDVVMTHRPNDYHPDHRYTSQAVQDAAFTVTVPHVCPDSPALRRNPPVFYLADRFQKPYPFQADAVVAIDSVLETKIDALACHRSQVFEWLPYVDQREPVPEGREERRAWLTRWVSAPGRDLGQRFSARLRADSEADVIEAFEICEYGGPLATEAMARLFP